jgi:hypothetical protein
MFLLVFLAIKSRRTFFRRRSKSRGRSEPHSQRHTLACILIGVQTPPVTCRTSRKGHLHHARRRFLRHWGFRRIVQCDVLGIKRCLR